MLVVDAYLGHRDDPSVARRLADATPRRVVLSDTERRRSRVRTDTEDGRDLGIVVARDLGDGDVLVTESGDLVEVSLVAVEALVLDFAEADVSTTAALAMGHALGNRHWKLAVRGSEALFPVTDTRERMEAAVADHLPEEVTTRYEAVSPTLFDGTEADHTHGDGAHSHAHGDENHSRCLEQGGQEHVHERIHQHLTRSRSSDEGER